MRTLLIIQLLLSSGMPAQMAGQTLSFFRPTQEMDRATAVAANASGIYVAGNGVKKYDWQGNELWTQASIGPGSGVAADATGAYIVVGATLRKYSDGGSELWTRSLQQEYTTSAVAADTSGVYAAVRDGYRHSLAKYSSNGTQLWIKRPRTMAPRVRNRFFHSIQCR